MKINQIDTPALLIEKAVMMRNIQTMQALADENGIALRPHIKTHKMPMLAQMQLNAGACGIAVAKLTEAEVMADAGFQNIQIANVIVGEAKLNRLLKLNMRLNHLSCGTDSIESASRINQAASEANQIIKVQIKIDSGFARLGLSDYFKIIELAKYIQEATNLFLDGIYTHAGQVYGAKSIAELEEIGTHEANFMIETAQKLRKDGMAIHTVSVGSTPGAKFSAKVKGVTELRAGNYIFHDMIQVALGITSIENCALSVLATVISVPEPGRAIIDAGSKALSLDIGAHGNKLLKSFGKIKEKDGCIARLSEEHGIINFEDSDFAIGEKIRIIPNHACAVCNLYDSAWLIQNGEIIEEISISARGKSQ